MKKNLRNLVAVTLAAVVATFALLPFPASAQSVPTPQSKVVSAYYNAADVSPALYVKFVGVETNPTAATTVAVSAGASITFIKDGAAYDGFECPVSGALGGIIDTTNAACDTLGEIVDVINSDIKKNFVAVIANGLRSDPVQTSGNLLTIGASTAVKSPTGMPLFWDTSVDDNENLGLWDINKGILNWMADGSRKLPSASAWADTDSTLIYGLEQFTNAGTLGALDVYCVVENYAAHTETVYTLFEKTAAATTVVGQINELTAVGGWHCQGGKLFVRIDGSGADTSAWKFNLYGYATPMAFGR